ncbi:HAD family phosphatase [Vibrio sp. S9_S30]|uniref:HAD family hydrolase n=1 Tax=Vibrio sp. S9_S30 TaxID=2720226 RepID=UPI001680205F|nr:HAD family phosphatase [Vibrio sp. S9_S30]MBD1556729.1 HAD family phosphatase [Vibrio sp. S9_S30]
MAIKNIVFDVGNVIVKWSPLEIVSATFGVTGETAQKMARDIFSHQVWLDLNKGRLTEDEAKLAYQAQLQLSVIETEQLFDNVKASLSLLEGTENMMRDLKASGYGIYALTDNVHEIVAFLKDRYDFWSLFDKAIVSAEWDVLKPDPRIYQLVVEQCNVEANESVFLDDMPANVEGARTQGFHAFQFSTAEKAREDLRSLGVCV